MAKTTIAVSVVLFLIGVGGWLLAGQSSVTALIPAFFGIPLLIAGLVALNEGRRRHAMHAAAVVALLGAGGSLSRALPALGGDEPLRLATQSQLLTGLVLVVFLVLCIRSFIAARRAQG
ncbi:MAG: hypothetical protein AAGG11_17005 [Pseudomonadota bacterium]